MNIKYGNLSNLPAPCRPPLLCRSQRTTVAHLVAIARARSGSLAASIDPSLLPIWSAPLLSGPTGTGKEFICRETARQLRRPFLSLNLGCWVLSSNADDRQSTAARIKEFRQKNPAAVLYFSGLESFASRIVGEGGGHNAIYTAAVAADLEDFLREVCTRTAPTGSEILSAPAPTLLVILAGRFASFWGETELGGASEANAWKNADAEEVSGQAFEEWMDRGESGLPANLLRWMGRPFQTISRPRPEETRMLAAEALRRLPMLDGALDATELAEALAGKEGWGALRRCIEGYLTRSTLAGETEADTLLAADQQEAEGDTEKNFVEFEEDSVELTGRQPDISQPEKIPARPSTVTLHGVLEPLPAVPNSDAKQPPTLAEALLDPEVAQCAVLARLHIAWTVELLRSCAVREEELATDAQLRWGEGTLGEVADILESHGSYSLLLSRRRVFAEQGLSQDASGNKKPPVPGPLLVGIGQEKCHWTPGLLRLDAALRALREFYSRKKSLAGTWMLAHFIQVILSRHPRLAPLSRLDVEASLEAARVAIYPPPTIHPAATPEN